MIFEKIYIQEKNGYKNLLEIYESSDKKDNEEVGILKSRITELEKILEEYKKALNESDELQLGNKTTFNLNQVNLNLNYDQLLNNII